MKRIFDLVFLLAVTPFVLLPLLLVYLLVLFSSRGPVLYWSDRVGRNNVIFRMPKFRSMHVNAPVVATREMSDPELYYTQFGSFLRKMSLDELPQLWSIFVGDMSFVGPRPALFNQIDLIQMRTAEGVHALRPGLTGLAQVNGRDELSTVEKVFLDAEYLRLHSFWLDIKILCLTFSRVCHRDGISH
jgi:O-antigen biosynthesis protein WbqP